MAWLRDLFANPTSVESSILVFALVVALGLALGSISFRGIRLGVAGVLFAGLVFGHFGLAPNAEVLGFTREFGLVLFVFAVGLSVGPGFVNALRRHGLSLNTLAGCIVLSGAAICWALMAVGGMTGPVAVGLFCGATTNTPSLAAAGQALRDQAPGDEALTAALQQAVPEHPLLAADSSEAGARHRELLAEVTKLPGMAYAVAYPGGVFGIIAAILILRRALGVDPTKEAGEIERQRAQATPPLEHIHVRIANPNLSGLVLAQLPALEALEIVVSRLQRGDREFVARPDLTLILDDVLTVVGRPDNLEQFVAIVGERTTVDPAKVTSPIHVQWVTVSQKKIAGQTIGELALAKRFGVQVTRVRRAGVELPPLEDVTLALGDLIRVVGLPESIARVARELGDSARRLGEPELVPIFVGIVLGILVGSIPLTFPGVPGSVKLGLAGGPLLVAILLSRVQRIGSIVWYLPRSASLMLKDLGIVVFLASVGLKSGDLFVDAFVGGPGLWWVAAGAVITLVPLLVVGVVAHWYVGERYLSIVGLLAGSMTDPPALAFANSLSGSEIPSVSYATVYPLSMILRIISAQLLMMYWTG